MKSEEYRIIEMSELARKKFRALISVSDKKDVLLLAEVLNKYNWEIVATKGTCQYLNENDILAIPVDTMIDNKQCLGHRMKTLEIKILGGLLWDKSNNEHCRDAEKYGFIGFDLVVENFYPFSDMINALEVNELIEYIDVGGPTMVRSALKNYRNVVPVVDIEDYSNIIEKLISSKGDPNIFHERERLNFAKKALKHIIDYDISIYRFLNTTA